MVPTATRVLISVGVSSTVSMAEAGKAPGGGGGGGACRAVVVGAAVALGGGGLGDAAVGSDRRLSQGRHTAATEAASATAGPRRECFHYPLGHRLSTTVHPLFTSLVC